MSQKALQIDPEGYPMLEGVRVTDEAFGRDLLSNMFVRDFVTYTKSSGEEIVVEAFDAPLMVLTLDKGEGTLWKFQMPYDYVLNFDIQDLRVDTFDRFCGRFENGVTFVLTRAAQARFFNLVEDYTDTSVTVNGKEIEIASKYTNAEKVIAKEFWSELYTTKETPWDLDGPTPVLQQGLAQLKLPRQRVLVLSAGRGHDAVEIANAGHVVTAVDFSEVAHKEFTERYGTVKNLSYLVADVFKLPTEMNQQFDLIFDHTFFVAVDPERRREVVQLWKRLLVPRGHVLGIFFVMDKFAGPAFGSTEWELFELFKKDLDLIYWTRTKASAEKRKNKELLVYGAKKT